MVIHEHYRRFLRSARRRCLVRTSRHVPRYRLLEADVVRLVRVEPHGDLVFEPVKRGDHRQGFLTATEWEWRKPEWCCAGRRA